MQNNTSQKAFSGANLPDISYTLNLIRELHEGQADQNGEAYIDHPIRVANNLRTIDPQVSDDIVMAALLHDTIEDCDVDAEFLKKKGYSDSCIAMVKLVTKPEGDTRNYEQVIDDLVASDNRGAMLIKIADNMDNLHPERVKDLQQKDPEKAERLGKRYHMSIDKLSKAAGLDKDHIFSLIDNSASLQTIDSTLE